MNKKSSVGKNAFNTFQYPFFGIDILASLFSGQLFCESDAALNFDHRFWLQFDNLTFIMIPGADNVQTRQPGRPHTWAPPASHQPGHVSGIGGKMRLTLLPWGGGGDQIMRGSLSMFVNVSRLGVTMAQCRGELPWCVSTIGRGWDESSQNKFETRGGNK